MSKKKYVKRKIGAKRGCGKVVGVIVGKKGEAVHPYKKGYLTYMTKNGSVVQVKKAKRGSGKQACSVRSRRKRRSKK